MEIIIYERVVIHEKFAQKKPLRFWTDPQKLDSLIRLPEGIEFGIALGSIPLVFVWSGHGCSSGYIPLALF